MQATISLFNQEITFRPELGRDALEAPYLHAMLLRNAGITDFDKIPELLWVGIIFVSRVILQCQDGRGVVPSRYAGEAEIIAFYNRLLDSDAETVIAVRNALASVNGGGLVENDEKKS